jgi:hypothetical protein
MAVEQQMPPAGAAMAHHHRMPGRRPGGGLESQALQIGHQPVGGAGAIGRIGRVGRNRGDSQQRHQPVQRLGQSFVDPGENGDKRVGHGISWLGWRRHKAYQAAGDCPELALCVRKKRNFATERRMRRVAAAMVGLGLAGAALAGTALAGAVPIERGVLGQSEVTLYRHPFLQDEELATLRLVMTNEAALAIFVPQDKAAAGGFAET